VVDAHDSHKADGSSGSRVVLAEPRPVVRMGAGSVALLLVLIFTSVAISEGTLRSHVEYFALSSLVVWLAHSAMTARVEAVGDRLVLINVVTSIAVPRERIRRVSGNNGLVVELDNGKRFESTAYGSSVLQILFPSVRFQHRADGIRKWIDSRDQDESAREAGGLTPRKSLRRWLGIEVSVTLLLGQVAGIALYRSNEAALGLLQSIAAFFFAEIP
jgi:hypothetical protein